MNIWEFLTVLVLAAKGVILLAGTAWLVGWHDWSAWWFVVSILLASSSLKTGKAAEGDE